MHEQSQAFDVLTNSDNYKINLLLYELKPFTGLLRLLDCPSSNTSKTENKDLDYIVADNSIHSILNILIDGGDSTISTSQHPFFQSLSECGGIKKIFELFQKNLNSYTKDYSALIIGFVYRAQEITDQLMKKEIISYLKNLLNDTDDWKKKISLNALKYLSQNAGLFIV
ncbi:MAG: hypothetical protein EZS28_052397 [Streblomastix strix]|uniref:Uncharacterized protein n=1 Tax=Streblomastix strix TaxID=222440 RepID=A0A5J4S925_9EUKA|nr:MAG: hypothetical protein EZS28_052397 [Streblomastix strix]